MPKRNIPNSECAGCYCTLVPYGRGCHQEICPEVLPTSQEMADKAERAAGIQVSPPQAEAKCSCNCSDGKIHQGCCPLGKGRTG